MRHDVGAGSKKKGSPLSLCTNRQTGIKHTHPHQTPLYLVTSALAFEGQSLGLGSADVFSALEQGVSKLRWSHRATRPDRAVTVQISFVG